MVLLIKPQNRILTKNDYDKHYNDPNSKLKNCEKAYFQVLYYLQL